MTTGGLVCDAPPYRLLRKVSPVDLSFRAGRSAMALFRAVREQLLHATLIEMGDVRPSAVKPPLEFVSLTHKLVPLREKVLVLLAEPVPIVFDPGAIRLS